MKKFFRLLRIRYWDRIERYRGWRDIFVKSGWEPKQAREQALRQSAWYDPATGRSVEMILDLEGLIKRAEKHDR